MPQFLEAKLRKQAKKLKLKGRRADEYVYGTENKIGAMHGNRETSRGKRMEEKHERTLSDLA